MTGTLSSDTLERQFGPTELGVLLQDGTGRVICTKTPDGHILELSEVIFRAEGIAAFPNIHREVTGGASMGKAFKARGVAFRRVVHGAYRFSPPTAFSDRFGATKPATVIDVSILVGSGVTPYADILEIYSPEVAWNLKSSADDQAISKRVENFGKILDSLDTP